MSKGFSGKKGYKNLVPILLVLSAVIALFFLIMFSMKKTTQLKHGMPGLRSVSISELWETQNYREIVNQTEAVLERDPLDTSAMIFQAMSYFYLSREQISMEERESCLDRAIIMFRKVLAVSDDPVIVRLTHYHLGKAYVMKGPYYADIAVRLLQSSLGDKNNQYSDIRSYLGEAYYQLGDIQESLAFFSLAAEQDRGTGLLMRLAEVAVQAGEYTTAIEAYNEGIKKTNNQLERETALYQLGKLYYDMKRYQNAKGALEEYVTYNKANPEAYFMLGEIAFYSGEGQRARQLWVQCTRIDPRYRPALNRLYN